MNDDVTAFPGKKPHFNVPTVNQFVAAAQQHYAVAQLHDAYITVLRNFSIGAGNQDALDRVTTDLIIGEEEALKLTKDAFGVTIAAWPHNLQALDYIRAQTIDDLQWAAEGDSKVRRHALLVHVHRAMGVSCVPDATA